MACPTGKKPYRNAAAARRALLSTQFTKRGKPRGPHRLERSAYQCGICKRWHLTHYECGPVRLDSPPTEDACRTG